MKMIAALTLILGLGSTTLAVAEDLTVLYGSGAPKSYQTQHFLDAEFQSAGSHYQLVPVYKPASFQPKPGQKILVISTEASGLEPILATVLAGWSDKSKVVLVILAKGAPVTPVEVRAASSATAGVDAVTASTAWDEGNIVVRLFGGERPAEYRMHQDWTKKALALLDSRE